jgi:hypothetical protein
MIAARRPDDGFMQLMALLMRVIALSGTTPPYLPPFRGRRMWNPQSRFRMSTPHAANVYSDLGFSCG